MPGIKYNENGSDGNGEDGHYGIAKIAKKSKLKK
jgi:hypothetical protein